MATSGVISSTTDPTSLLNTQLASALSTLGDAQFWEETISPSTIRNELSASDPSNPNSTPTLLKGMKWLLASISKGRDVSDFYPHVVKLVGATSLEVRKMVYMYLVQYADHDATTRELSLLSINSFQRGLADAEQLIRALALRVLSSIRISDILQIQILGVQKCAKDRSPYVRKCAANALTKLASRADDDQQKEMLLDIMVELLNNDTSTMVLSSAVLAFCELCPTRLELLHSSYRKICHLLTDMDEWGQVVILDVLSRYCRKFFKEPRGWKNGTAEKIDRERRVRRTLTGVAQQGGSTITASKSDNTPDPLADMISGSTAAPTKTIKRRVVKEGFYSDEEDESVEEIVEETPLTTTRNILGLPGVTQHVDKDADEDMDLDEDHKLLLQSAMPLLKSRNAGVVLGVCSLLYYCGVSSVKTRSAIGKALVRIHRGRREIQYVVLTSIRTLVGECPSAFAPFLNDFFVKAMDPPHTRRIKIDILVSLALEPAAIEAVLQELRTYIRSPDKAFVVSSIQAVGRVAELARIVYDRHGQNSGSALQERQTANRIALDCLYGLTVLTQVGGDNKIVVGEAVCVMQSILTMLLAGGGDEPGSLQTVEDPNSVQLFALRRILLLLANTLATRTEEEEDDDAKNDDDDEKEQSELEKISIELPDHAMAAALSMVGDWLNLASNSPLKAAEPTLPQVQNEVVRLVDRAFPEMSPVEKCQALHFCAKTVLSLAASGGTSAALCEHVLSMGRIDAHPDVKDRARMESAIIHTSCGLKHDTENMDAQPAVGMKMTLISAQKMLLAKKPAPSFLKVDDDASQKSSFRFGTLSSLVGHQARGTYLELPPWSDKNSPKALRDPIEAVKEQVSGVPAPSNAVQGPMGGGGFYNDDLDSDSSSSDSSSSSESSSDGENDADSESDSDSDDSSSSSSASGTNLLMMPNMGTNRTANSKASAVQPVGQTTILGSSIPSKSIIPPGSDSSSSSDDDDSSSSFSSSSDGDQYHGDISSGNNKRLSSSDENLLSLGSQPAKTTASSTTNAAAASSSSSGGMLDDLKGLVMAPIAVDASKASDPDIERDSSSWSQLVRPQVAGGLLVKARFLRGPTRAREAQLQGLDPTRPSVVCVQVQFGNKKTDTNSIRRIRILPKAHPGGTIALKKALCPPDIAELKPGQVANAVLCLEFSSASNREGDLVGKFDVKTSTGGGIPLDIKPTIGDLLQQEAPSSSKRQVSDFDVSFQRLQGFQRVSTKFQSTSLAPASSVCQQVLKSAALVVVGSGDNQPTTTTPLRFLGALPAGSHDLVYVRIDLDNPSTTTNGGGSSSIMKGTVTVCSGDAMAVNSILSILKHALA